MTIPQLQLFYSLEYGGFTFDEIYTGATRGGHIPDSDARDILRESLTVTETEVVFADLVSITERDLGVSSGDSHDDLIAKARKLGLLVCPEEISLWLVADEGYVQDPDSVLRMGAELSTSHYGYYVWSISTTATGKKLLKPAFRADLVRNPEAVWIFVRAPQS